MHENSWKYLTDPDGTMLGLKNDTVDMKGWLNDVVERVNSIEDKDEAIKTLFVINQKIGYVKGKNEPYRYPVELYDRLQITVNILLKKRLSEQNK